MVVVVVIVVIVVVIVIMIVVVIVVVIVIMIVVVAVVALGFAALLVTETAGDTECSERTGRREQPPTGSQTWLVSHA